MSGIKYRFFCDQTEVGTLSEEESAHALRVLRLNITDLIELTDGKGNLWVAEITGTGGKKVQFELKEHIQEPKSGPEITIAIAPTKSIDRFEFFLEKTTELGVDQIIPVLTRNSERKELKVDKLRKNLISAVKQSGNLFVPVLNNPVSLKDFLSASASEDAQKFIAHCASDDAKTELFDAVKSSKKILILIGPEGDFTPEEITLAKQNGFIPVSLGKSRLRTETAGITACLTSHIKYSQLH